MTACGRPHSRYGLEPSRAALHPGPLQAWVGGEESGETGARVERICSPRPALPPLVGTQRLHRLLGRPGSVWLPPADNVGKEEGRGGLLLAVSPASRPGLTGLRAQ